MFGKCFITVCGIVFFVAKGAKALRCCSHTHHGRLAFLLHEKQLPPVGAGDLHPEHNQVTKRQHPQVWRKQELFKSALIIRGFRERVG